MAKIKGELKQKTGTSTYDVMMPHTEADIVAYSNTSSGLAATDVQSAIDEIVSSGTGVTGVKGNAESNYRTGQVNLTPANIGAEPAFTDGSAVIASVSSDVVTIKAGVAQSGGAISNSSGSDITLAKVAKTGAYSDLSNKPTIGDGTLTIKVAGTSKGTFNANATSNTEVNITAADLDLTGALRYMGVAQTTQPVGGTYLQTTIGGTTYYVPVTDSGITAELAAKKGDVIVVGSKEYVCNTAGLHDVNAFQEIGDESSYALKTVNISAGTGLTGGGTLAANRTISLADGYGDTKNPYASKTANQVLAAPNGSNGAPSFRALVAADIPSLNYVPKPAIDVGSTTKPIYYDVDDNALKEGSTYAGGTKVSLNGTDKGGDSASIYAPTSAPTSAGTDVKAYVVGSSSTSSLATEYINSKVYVKNNKLYSNDAEVLTGNQTITLSGDVSGSGATSISVTLANSGVTAGTYSAVQVNTKGIVTSGGQVLEVIEHGATPSVVTGGWYFEKDAV